MILKILTNTQKEVNVEVDQSKTIGSLREQIEDQEGFLHDSYRFCLRDGTPVDDDNRSMQSYGIPG